MGGGGTKIRSVKSLLTISEKNILNRPVMSITNNGPAV